MWLFVLWLFVLSKLWLFVLWLSVRIPLQMTVFYSEINNSNDCRAPKRYRHIRKMGGIMGNGIWVVSPSFINSALKNEIWKIPLQIFVFWMFNIMYGFTFIVWHLTFFEQYSNKFVCIVCSAWLQITVFCQKYCNM